MSPQKTPRTQNASANLMNKYIDRLLDASKDLLSHFAIDVQDRDAAWADELHTLNEFFERYYKIYTMDAAPYIDIDAVSERTRSSIDEILWQRMTQAVATANLANLLSQVEDLDDDLTKAMPVLQRIDDHFPIVFTPGGRDGLQNQNWLEDGATVEQAFAIRVQRFIATLEPGVHPLRALAMVFFNNDCDDDELLDEYLNTAEFRPFDGFDINAVEVKQLQDRIHSFRNLLTQMRPDGAIAQLRDDESEYNFGSFLAGLKDWISASEAKVPGPTQPLAHLAYDNNSPSSAGAQLQGEANTSRFTASGINALKQRLNPGHAATQQVDDGFFHMDAGASYNNFDSQSMDGTMLEVRNSLQQQILASQNEGSMYAAAAAAQAATQNLSSGAGRKRNRKGTGDGNGLAKRARDIAAMPPPASFPAPDPNAPAGSQSVDIDPLALSQAARLITRANKKQSMPKARRPWTVHDTQQLVRAIHVYRAKWSTIQKAIENGHVAFNVVDRDQQALRDKARLVKVDILKCVYKLPSRKNRVRLT